MTAAADRAPQPGLLGRRFGRYEVLTQIASGGMATVYVARAVGVAGFERLVALKVLHPHLAHEEEFLAMFLDEARLAARIRHPNVVPTLDISDSGGDGYFLVMEYVEGDHLGGLLQRAARQGERLPAPVVARVVLDALAGLSAAHRLTDERGQPLLLVHRDISPHNLLVGVDGIARLTDFGVAKAEVRLSSTREGQFKGKLAYMAPEQASTGQTDQRSDIFSMGVVLWESLTARRLFRGANNAETLNRILREPIPDVSSVVPELAPYDAVLRKALERDVEARFQSAEEFAEALEQAAAQAEGTASGRLVGATVRRVAAEKLDDEASRIRAAIDQLGHFELEPGSLPRPTESTYPSQPGGGRTEGGTEVTVAARPSARARDEQTRSDGRPRWWLWGGLGALLLVLLAVVWLVSGGDEEPPPMADPTEEGPGSEATGAAAGAAARPAAQPAVDEAEGAAARAVADVPVDTAQGGNDGAEVPSKGGTVDEGAAAGDQPTEAAEQATTSRGRSRGRGRQRGHGHRGRRSSVRQPAPSESPSPATPPPADDDLLANPYRR